MAVLLSVLMLGSYGCSWFDTTPDPSPGDMLFFDDFTGGQDAAWQIASGNWETQAGEFHLTDGGDGDAYVGTGYSWTDYVVEADVKWGDGHDAYGWFWNDTYVIVRASDDLNKVVLKGSELWLQFTAWVDGEEISEEERSASVAGAPATSQVAVQVSGDSYTCLINGVVRLVWTFDGRPTGTAGVGARGARGGDDPAFRFDNFSVTALP